MFHEDFEVLRAFVHAIDQIAHTPANTQTIRDHPCQQKTVSSRRLWPSHDTPQPDIGISVALQCADSQA